MNEAAVTLRCGACMQTLAAAAVPACRRAAAAPGRGAGCPPRTMAVVAQVCRHGGGGETGARSR